MMSFEQASKETTTSAINLQKLVPLRFFIVIFFSILLTIAVLGLHIPLPAGRLVTVLAAMTILNALTMMYLRFGGSVGERGLFTHIVLDVGSLSALFYLSGGWTNPFVSLYLLPLALTATVLPGRYTWIMVGLTATCYTLLVFWYVPMPVSHHPGVSGFNIHVIGMWMGFLLGSLAIAYFVVRMAATLRARDQELSLMRESSMRNEQMIALATLAAGAAHELGTPLGTMAIMLNEIDNEQPLTTEQLGILRKQVQRCKEILGSMAASAGEMRAESGERRPLVRFLQEIVDEWLQVRANVRIDVHLEENQPEIEVLAERTLAQAIMNILNNAADVSPDSVEFSARWTDDLLILEISDRGPGLDPDIRKRTGALPGGTPKISQGLGLGLFLVQSTLDRFGGSMHLRDREGGGTVCRLNIPLTQIRI